MATRMRLILGGEKKPKPKDAETMWFCPVCNGHTAMRVKAGLTWRRGKVVGGQSVHICEQCHRRGEWTPID